ncbi:MAG: nucleoside hydrolase [Ruminococcaceae bacterium]|nr:nucleoside hydrolase [Oscillospiraceae bacterium]
MEFTLDLLKNMICSDQKHRIILDTDAYNEVDDQFCIAYCMLAKEKIDLLSINAAPFLNNRSTSPADGMEKSYQEIFKVMNLVDPNANIPVYRGSDAFLTDKKTAVESDAADNMINTVMNSEEPVIIVAIGAITNVASALIKCPDLAKKTAVVWLGGHALHYWHNEEFNFRQDVPAAQVVFDSGIPLVQVPCCGVCTEFRTTVPELKYYLEGKNELCDYLVSNVEKECEGYSKFGVHTPSRIIWDVTAAAVLICPKNCDMVTIPRPVISSDGLFSVNNARPHYIYVRSLDRDRIYGDLFNKLKSR